MKRYLLVMLMSLIFGFAPEGIAQQPRELLGSLTANQGRCKEFAVPATDSLIQSVIEQTNLDTLIRTVRILSGEDSITINDSTYLLGSRDAGHPHNDLAADFIYQTLSRFGLPTYDQNYSSTGRNVYGIKAGTDHPGLRFIICAHYDDRPVQAPAPGADDNASGTAAVLEAARILSQIPTPYTIVFALWDEEENGLVGSAYFAWQASQAREEILGVINLDMLGWDGDHDGLIDIQTNAVAYSAGLADLMQSLNDEYEFGLSPMVYNPGTGRSDHASFWNRGYSAIMLGESFATSGEGNPYYHSRYDRVEHFNRDYFHALSKLAVATIAHLAVHGTMPVSVATSEDLFVSGFELHQNYPNPFNPATTIAFALPHASLVTLKVYDVLGKEVATLVAEKLPAGRHQRVWEANEMASGMYVCRIEAGEFTQTRKLVLLR